MTRTATTLLLRNGGAALIDLEDYAKVSGYGWRAKASGHLTYVYAHIPGSGRNGGAAILHRVVMDAPSGVRVDHINGDGLDNRKANLRLCSNSQNIRNSGTYSRKTTAKLKGVYRMKSGYYRAQICCQYKKINLGNFADEESAGRAYDTAARKLFGEFSRCNFPAQEPQ